MRTSLRLLLALAACLSPAFASGLRAQSQRTVTASYSFTAGSDGAYPEAALIQGSDGNFYGTTSAGGNINGDGTVFQYVPAGSFSSLSSLYSFTAGSDGAYPQGALIQGSDGSFYGTTYGLRKSGSTDYGAVFRITPGNQPIILHTFSGDGTNTDGAYPAAGLVQDRDGVFYGTTFKGGSNNTGTVFTLTPRNVNGQIFYFHTTLYSFGSVDGDGANTDGANPVSTLVQGSDGNFYGTAEEGGPAGGTVFKISPGGTFNVVHAFAGGTDGAYPQCGLILGSDGNFYGTTSYTIFQVTPAGHLTTLYSVPDGSQMGFSSALLQASDGNFYGTSHSGGEHGFGTVFEVTPTGVFTILHSFSGLNADGMTNDEGAEPLGALIQGEDGNFYGTARIGGEYGFGTIFEVEVSPVITSATTAGATIGAPFSYQITATNDPTSYGEMPLFQNGTLPPGVQFNAATGLFSGTPTASGTYSLYITATNALSSGSQDLTITVDTPPAPAITSATTATATEGQAFSYQIVATNHPTSYAVPDLPAGLRVDAKSGLISGTPTVYGTKTLTLQATNAGGTGQATLSLNIAQETFQITSATSASATQGQPFGYQITATNSPTSYAAPGLPTGLSLNSTTGLIKGSPVHAGKAAVTISATNTAGTATARLTITIAAAAPVITSATSEAATQGEPFSYQITATNSPTSYTAPGLPTGLTLDTTTGLITGTPTNVGQAAVTISATNSAGTGTARLTITIAEGAPVIASATSASATQGKAFSYRITATNSPTSYGASGLPTGLSVDTSTGLITGTPKNVGKAAVTISATNATGTGTGKVTLTIAAP